MPKTRAGAQTEETGRDPPIGWRDPGSLLAKVRRSPFAIAALIYACAEILLVVSAPSDRFTTHTLYNHFALLADAWLHGRLDLGGPPPDYTGFNDFAVFQGKYYVTFPPMPAVLLVPLVAASRSVDAVCDGRFFILLAGVGPATVCLALDKMSRARVSARTRGENVFLAFAFAFATVYWFTAVQGTVWFAAHVVAVVFTALYLYASVDAAHPIMAGLCLGCAIATRTPLLFALPLFACELVRTARARSVRGRLLDPSGGFVKRATAFLAPLLATLGVLAWHNQARFGSPFEFGHRFLAIVWKTRIDKWGLFSVHYLGRNLGVMLTSMPFVGAKDAPPQINAHGLALTITSPFLLWVLWPRIRGRTRARSMYIALAVTAFAVSVPDLLYQNSGWIQFGYRFSNDFAVFLVAMIAVGGRKLGAGFGAAVAFAVAVNAFGALTFQRPGYEKYYYLERTQAVVYEPD